MAKTKISEFSSTPGNNTDIDSINIAEGCAPSGINDAIRELMAQLKDFQTGAAGDSFNGPVGTTTAAAGAFTTLTASSTATLNTLASSGATLTGGTINGMAIGGTTAAAVSATTLTTSSTVTHNGGTANSVCFLNGSKVLTSGSALTFDGTNLGVGGTSLSSTSGRSDVTINGSSSSMISYGVAGTRVGYIIHDGTDLTFANEQGGPLRWLTSAGEQMRLTSTGLGIGTSSIASGGGGGLTLGSTSSGKSFHVYSSSYANNGLGNFYGTDGNMKLQMGALSATSAYIFANTGCSLVLFSGGNTSATLDSSGNLGLGVTPSAWAGNLVKAFQIADNGASFSSFSTGNTSSKFAILSNNAYYDAGGWKYAQTAGSAQYRVANQEHQWYTAPSGTAGNAISFTQAMSLTAAGELLVGQTSLSQTTVGFSATAAGIVSTAMVASTSAANSYHLYSTGAGAYRFYVGLGGTINATNTTITAISDQRLKENVRDLDDGLDVVMALKPRKFDWKEGKGKDIKGDRGFIAQEFEQVLPDMIEEWKDPAPEGEEPYKAVNANLIPTLVKAIQELKAEFDAYKAAHP